MINCTLLVAVDCGTLADPTNGQVDTSEGTTLNNTATYSCDPGYVLDGGSTQFCDDEGQWMGSLPTCEGLCSVCSLW